MIKFIRKFTILIAILLGFFSLIFYVASKTDKNITKVDIVSNDGLAYVSKQDLINKIAKLNKKKWLDVDVSSLEKYLYSIKGVDYTLVKKVWPSTLVIYMYDYEPIAYWNNNQILLENMDIITPEVFNYDGDLPFIESTDKKSKDYIYETYQKLNKIANENNMEILKIFSAGNQFSILLSNDMKVILGSADLSSRLELFFKSYKKVKNYNSVKYFDMRYSDGFAIKYK